MAQETLTLRTMNNGGIIEAVDAALAKIAENIADINTPPTSPAGGINPAIYPAPPQQWLAQQSAYTLSRQLEALDPAVAVRGTAIYADIAPRDGAFL